MSRSIRWSRRLLILIIAAATLWFIVTQVFDRLDQRLPIFAALLVTYILAAYFILPVVIRASVTALGTNRIPRVTRAADGLAADPVNIVLVGSADELRSAFAAAGWHVADALTLRTAIEMAVCFVLNRPYPAAPFSALFLFGRKQDIGFQEDVGNSPRRRHHVRFWAAGVDPEAEISDVAFWSSRQRVASAPSHIWVGAATTDTGFGFQSMTWQISHRVDPHADLERDHVIASLREAGRVADERCIEAGWPVGTHFITDGRILHARLVS